MLGFVVRRLVATIPVLLVVTFVIFALLNLAGDPTHLLAGDTASADQIAEIRHAYGLDRALPVRYAMWLSSVLHGDLGRSLLSRQPVDHLIAQRLEPTLSLAACTMLVTVAAALPLGIAAAWRRDGWVDRIVTVGAVASFAIPIFVLAYVGIYVFALTLRWLPVQGFVDVRSGLGPFLAHMILPCLALSFGFIGWIAKVTRDSVLDVLAQDFIRTAAAKGADAYRILIVHALKNAAAPIVTILGVAMALLIGGVVVTETVFAIPGLGRLTVDAIAARDYPVIQGVVLVSALVYILVNLLVDVSYGLFDPRVRY
jgi:peptide/nickel transport system permease protein